MVIEPLSKYERFPLKSLYKMTSIKFLPYKRDEQMDGW